MKVLLVLEATLGGTSTHILDLADGLLEQGLDVHLAYSTLRADRGFTAGLTSLRAARPSLRCCEIPMTREVAASDIRSYLKLQRYVRAHGPFDVIHAHSTKAGFLSRLLVNRRGARMVYTPHGLMTLNPSLKGLGRRAVSVLESALSRISDAIIVGSGNERECAMQTGISSSRLTTIPNGVRPVNTELCGRQRREEIRVSLSLSPDTVCIGFVSRLLSYKEPGRVVEAFSLLRRQTKTPVALVVVGSGPLEAKMRRQVEDLGIEKDVIFLGYVDAVPIQAFDVLGHTSLFESFAYVFVEALSAGIPIVTTRVGAAPDLIEDGVTGYVCDPWDAQKFADYLQVLVEDPERRVAMSHAARERAAPYTVSRMVDSITQLYQRLCARPRLAPSAQPETSVGDSR